MSRDIAEFDVVIVGAGPAGLAAACRLGQLSRGSREPISLCVVEKGSQVGAHIVSGALLEARALEELFPGWRDRGAPVKTSVVEERFEWLVDARRRVGVPHALVPAPLRNAGNYIVSLGRVCQWLAREAEDLGCDLLPGFAAVEAVYDAEGRVAGVATGEKGIAADGTPKSNAEPGTELRAKYVIFAEGCRGNLGRALERRFGLREGADPPHFGLAFKEVWQIDPAKHRPGRVLHTAGWPLDSRTEGGGFVYGYGEDALSVGFVVALNYRNPHLDPFAEFQRWKQHPRIRELLDGGRRIGYGARAVNKGGLQSLPRLAFPGGVLAGCDAGMLNGAKLKGIHLAMKSGMLAAEAAFEAVARGEAGTVLDAYVRRFEASWAHEELERARNFSSGVAKLGTLLGGALAFVEHNVLKGRSPLRLRNSVPDHAALVPAAAAEPIEYPPPDGVVSFDRASSVHLSNIAHDEDQPVHLRLKDLDLPLRENLPRYDEPAQRYCPAGVYEIAVDAAGRPAFRINAANCIHCKTCEIKDPAQNIVWLPPEGGSGPAYTDM